MNKYYISFGSFEVMLMAATEYQACIRVLQRYLKEERGYIDSLPTTFIVSQKGFDTHKDDLVIESNIIIRLLALSSGVMSQEELESISCQNFQDNPQFPQFNEEYDYE
jgi:uncharacterized protein (DUF1501 family)